MRHCGEMKAWTNASPDRAEPAELRALLDGKLPDHPGGFVTRYRTVEVVRSRRKVQHERCAFTRGKID